MTQNVLEQKPRVRGSKDASRQVTLEEVKAMPDDILRIAVAELDGWHDVKIRDGWCYGYRTPDQDEEGKSVPDYPHDLNATLPLLGSDFDINTRNGFSKVTIYRPSEEYSSYSENLCRAICEALVLCLSARGKNTSGSGASKPKLVGAAARKEGQ